MFINNIKRCTSNHYNKNIENKSKKGFYISFFSIVIGIAVCLSAIYIYNTRNSAYEVKYNGKMLGYVKQKDDIQKAFNIVAEDIKKFDSTIVINEALDFNKLEVRQDKISSVEDLSQLIKNELFMEFTCYSILINNQEASILRTSDEAKRVIDGIKEYYKTIEEKEDIEVIAVNIKDKIEIEPKINNIANVTDVDKAIEILTKDKDQIKKYTIAQGDTLWSISRDENIDVKDIMAANPTLDLSKIIPGQIINLTSSIPGLNVELELKVTQNKEIEYSTDYVKDDSIFKGKTKIVEEGSYGINKEIYDVIKLNGQELSKTLLTSQVVQEPVNRVIAQGTKNVVGTGAFIYPVKGNLTSGYGYRADGFHSGIDICASEGTPIYAADGGKVIQAGWYYGYGNLIIVDHANGYTSYYGHCSKIYVTVGQSVNQGDVIAAVGHTGDTSANHVHFEVRLNGKTQNPANYLK